MHEAIFDLSSFEDVEKRDQRFVITKHKMIITRWLVGEKLDKDSSLYIEAIISIIVSSIHRGISMKMFNKMQILSFRNFFY